MWFHCFEYISWMPRQSLSLQSALSFFFFAFDEFVPFDWIDMRVQIDIRGTSTSGLVYDAKICHLLWEIIEV